MGLCHIPTRRIIEVLGNVLLVRDINFKPSNSIGWG